MSKLVDEKLESIERLVKKNKGKKDKDLLELAEIKMLIEDVINLEYR